jgi:inner membrane protein
MPTVFTHAVAAFALSSTFKSLPRSFLALAALCAAVPDLDVIAFAFGIPYSAPLGHRGFTHSLLFAFLLAGILTLLTRRYNPSVSSRTVFSALFLATASHGLLDACTNGGLGVGFFIPFSNERFFFPWRPIRVSPIGLGGFLERGLPVLLSELVWIWLPALVIGGTALIARRRDFSEER